MSYAGAPSSDMILLRDEMHRTMMERGSNRLRDAITYQRAGWKPKATNDDVMWLMPFTNGAKVRASRIEAAPEAINRDPCVTCGVRADRHRLHGCAAYRRGRAA